MITGPAKPSPLGEPYHYHETGDGPELNTTDSTIDAGPHAHDIATGPNQAVDTGKGTGPGHEHTLPGVINGRAVITGIGNGGKVLVLRDHLRASAKLIESLAAELHSSARFHGNSNHDTPTYRKCKSWRCVAAIKFVASLYTEIPELRHNPHALAQYRRNLKRVQKAIQTPMQPVVAESLRQPDVP